MVRSHPKAPYLRLVVSKERPSLLNFGSGDLLEKMVVLFNRWRAANTEDLTNRL
jgi:hypothetical protein